MFFPFGQIPVIKTIGHLFNYKSSTFGVSDNITIETKVATELKPAELAKVLYTFLYFRKSALRQQVPR